MSPWPRSPLSPDERRRLSQDALILLEASADAVQRRVEAARELEIARSWLNRPEESRRAQDWYDGTLSVQCRLEIALAQAIRELG